MNATGEQKPRTFARITIISRPEQVNQAALNAMCSVPFEGAQLVNDRVVTALLNERLNGIIEFLSARNAVILFDVNSCRCVVCIRPEAFFRACMQLWQLSQNIEFQPSEIRVTTHNFEKIARRAAYCRKPVFVRFAVVCVEAFSNVVRANGIVL